MTAILRKVSLIPRRAADARRDAASRMHPLTLRFSSEELEESFLCSNDRSSRRQIRAALVLAIFLYLAFFALDLWVMPDLAQYFLTLRLGVAAVAAVVLAFTFHTAFYRWRRVVLNTTSLVMAGGLLCIIAIGGSRAETHYVGIILALIAMHTIFRLRFPDTVALSAIIIVAFDAQFLVFQDREWWTLANSNFFLLSTAVLGSFASYDMERFARMSFVHHRASEEERQRSEDLLDNVLPPAIAARLKGGENVIADRYQDATVLFADIVGFTDMAGRKEPEEVVDLLNSFFTAFDRIARDCGVLKIKTIGDAAMLVGGCPEPLPDHAERIAEAAIAIREWVRAAQLERSMGINVRIGVATGPVMAGVIGENQLSYDLWGDTVNTASRMETTAPVGEIHVTETMYGRLRDSYAFRPRGEIDVKGKGPMATFLLQGRLEDELGRRAIA